VCRPAPPRDTVSLPGRADRQRLYLAGSYIYGSDTDPGQLHTDTSPGSGEGVIHYSRIDETESQRGNIEMSGVWGCRGDGRRALEGEISPTVDAQYNTIQDCDTDTWGTLRGKTYLQKTDRSSPPFSTLSTLVLPPLLSQYF